MTNSASAPRAKTSGTGSVTYRCYTCGETMPAEQAVLIHIEGRLVAVHGTHKQEELTNGR